MTRSRKGDAGLNIIQHDQIPVKQKNSFPTQNFNHQLTLLAPKISVKPLEGFTERSRRFRRKIIHLTANTYVYIGKHIRMYRYIHTEALAHTGGSVSVMSYEF